jgi:hypothetical protein
MKYSAPLPLAGRSFAAPAGASWPTAGQLAKCQTLTERVEPSYPPPG